MQKIFNLFDFSQKVDYKNEVLAGLTVAMTMIPESLNFMNFYNFVTGGTPDMDKDKVKQLEGDFKEEQPNNIIDFKD